MVRETDTISRQATIDALNRCTEIYLNNLPPTIYKTDAVEAVTALPTAERKGHWNAYYRDKDDITYSCNQCGYGAPFQIIGGKISQKKWNYCPNCGADMRGDNDD